MGVVFLLFMYFIVVPIGIYSIGNSGWGGWWVVGVKFGGGGSPEKASYERVAILCLQLQQFLLTMVEFPQFCQGIVIRLPDHCLCLRLPPL